MDPCTAMLGPSASAMNTLSSVGMGSGGLKTPLSLVARNRPSPDLPIRTMGLPEASSAKRGQRLPNSSPATGMGSAKSHVIWAEAWLGPHNNGKARSVKKALETSVLDDVMFAI